MAEKAKENKENKEEKSIWLSEKYLRLYYQKSDSLIYKCIVQIESWRAMWEI